MKQRITILLICIAGIAYTQTGTLQIYADKDVKIYVNGSYKGKYGGHESGLTLQNIPVGTTSVKGAKQGYKNKTVNVEIRENETTELYLKLERGNILDGKTLGFDLYLGSFGQFISSDSSTKSLLTFGASMYLQFAATKNMSISPELVFLWSLPKGDATLRMIMHQNLRFDYKLYMRGPTFLDFTLSGGSSIWPGSTKSSSVSPSFNQTRYGWNVRVDGGLGFYVTRSTSLVMQFGYMVSSTANEGVWIRHSSMILTAGPRFYF